MARSRRRRRRLTITAGVVICAGVLGFVVWPGPSVEETNAPSNVELAAADGTDAVRPSAERPGQVPAAVPNRTTAPDTVVVANESVSVVRGTENAAKGRSAEAAGELLAARDYYALALKQGLPPHEAEDVRGRLLKLAEATIFSRRRVSGDALTGTYTVQAGDTLGRIAKRFKITAGLLAGVNGIDDPNRIRQGQTLKVIQGPFRAVVEKGRYRMSVYLQDVLVREYAVGLGIDDSTPTGLWRVGDGEKLPNPTYHPPASVGGPIIQADDPANPLGEHWIGLQGIQGDAVGQRSYGIHGTIEPESIGRSVSAGCIRMHNEDVAQVFDMLAEQHSEVLVVQ